MERKLGEISLGKSEIGHIGQFGQGINVDPEKAKLNPKLETMAGGEGFEPSTPNLGGWCSIRTELRGSATWRSYSPKFPSSTSVSLSGVITVTFKLASNSEYSFK